MIYFAHEATRLATRPLAAWLEVGTQMARSELNPLRSSLTMRTMATLFELPHRQLKDYGKPKYEVRDHLGDVDVLIEPEVVATQPFADLLRFSAPDGREKQKVLIAAALSGHHATLLQGTITAFAQYFDTHITDWKNARDVPLSEGEFGFDEYVDHLIAFIEAMGPGTHLVATCQAAPPAMVAAAILAKRNPELVPPTITLMGGPVDTRINPGKINKLSNKLPLKLFELNNIHKVPPGYPGSGRRVYPGFYQLTGFIGLNPKPHFRQYAQFAKNSIRGEEEATDKFRSFYDEYFAVLDMTEEFYIESLRKVFMEHHIPRGLMEYRGEKVDFASVEGMRVLTVEGANDHLCPPGQTEAAHHIFSGIPAKHKHNHIQEGVGHYGVFSGSKFAAEIFPVIRTHIEA
uniref:polyhydroxyalkanoate depolymerase n=1 Tax=Parerythrobacter lutipelagi TaxID=1964208 RepID=UPI0010F7057F|nr:polyhydroxyalkanoate depolymerase [Parerythrobacter lutipelagi]